MIDEHPTLPGLGAAIFVATVAGKDGDRYRLDREGERLLASRAAGCLVDPTAGDTVLLVTVGEGSHTILSVLSRTSGPLSITVPEGLSLTVQKGPLTVRAKGGTEFETPAFSADGESFSIRFSEMVLGVTRFTLVGETISFVASRIEQLAKTVETAAHWIAQRAHVATRDVETLDHSRAGQTLIESDTVLSLESKTTLVNARDWFKVDSDQIHLG